MPGGISQVSDNCRQLQVPSFGRSEHLRERVARGSAAVRAVSLWLTEEPALTRGCALIGITAFRKLLGRGRSLKEKVWYR